MPPALIEAGAPGYDEARLPAIANFHDSRPQAIAYCADAADVAETIARARRSGLPLAIRSGGHCFAGRSSTDGVVIDVSPMDTVTVDGTTATVGAGVRLGPLYDALDAHGMTLPAGCGPTVGIAGLTLGGGIGVLGRAHGLTCDRLLAAEIVLADGTAVRCDAREHPDLFWALRGSGGGQFGVVTSLVFDLLPAPTATLLHLLWPRRHAASVIEAWQEWAPDAPDEVSASLRLAGDVQVMGVVIGTAATAQPLVAELVQRAGVEPAVTVAQLPYREVKRRLVDLGTTDAPSLRHSRSGFFRHLLPAASIAAMVQALPDDGIVNFTPWGGAYNRVPVDATAFAHRAERFLVEHIATAGSRLPQVWSVIGGFATGGVYPNFPDPDLSDPWCAYHGANLERLLRVKAAHDPGDTFGFPQSLRS